MKGIEKKSEATKVDPVEAESENSEKPKDKEDPGFLSSLLGNVEGLFKDPDLKN